MNDGTGSGKVRVAGYPAVAKYALCNRVCKMRMDCDGDWLYMVSGRMKAGHKMLNDRLFTSVSRSLEALVESYNTMHT